MKTGHEIETDIYEFLKGSSLMAFVNGGLYRNGTRPRDSRLEDVVVIFTTADGEQVQEGVVTLNVYVPDLISNESNGVPMENISRTVAVERAVLDEVQSWKAGLSDYRFRLKEAVHTNRDPETQQSFVVARIGFQLF